MVSNMKKSMAAGVLAAVVTLGMAASAMAQGAFRTFTVFNNSQYRIDRVYVSPTHSNQWGIDRLGNSYLHPTYRFDLNVIPGYYDVKLIDRDGDSCVVPNVDMRSGNTWTITNRILLACEFASL